MILADRASLLGKCPADELSLPLFSLPHRWNRRREGSRAQLRRENVLGFKENRARIEAFPRRQGTLGEKRGGGAGVLFLPLFVPF